MRTTAEWGGGRSSSVGGAGLARPHGQPGDLARDTYRTTAAAFTACMAVTLATATPASGQCSYQVTMFQAPPCPIFGPPPIDVSGLGDGGAVVGEHEACNFVHVAYVWTESGGLVDLPLVAYSEANDANAAGVVVGLTDFADDGLDGVAFMFADGIATSLGTPPETNFSEAIAINEANQVAGNWRKLGEGVWGSFVWSDGVMVNLSLPLGPNSQAADINDLGQVVGWMGSVPYLGSHAYLWDDGDVTDLGLPPDAYSSEAIAINNGGQVLVEARFAEGVFRSYIWESGQWTDLGLPEGYQQCHGRDLNDAGQVVGAVSPGVDYFLWQDGVMTLDSDLVLDMEVNVLLRRINQLGQIVAEGSFDGDQAVFLLTPADQPPGDLDHDCDVDVVDFLGLLAAWGACPPGACFGDLDDDGFVGVSDLLLLLGHWALG